VPKTYDLNEIVELVDIRLQIQSREFGGFKRATMPLREAVTTVIEGWQNDKFRQLSAVIVRGSGTPIRTLQEIKHLYEEVRLTSREAVEIERPRPKHTAIPFAKKMQGPA